MSAKFDFNTPHNSLSRDKLNAEDGDIRDIHYGDILIKYNAVVDAQADDIPHITNSSVSDYADSLLMDGDVVFADTAEDETAGKAVEIQKADGNNVVAGLHTIVARPKDYFSPNFLGHRFNSDSYHSQLVPLLQGIKVLSISKAALADTTFSWPQKKDEQQKIGEFFQQLDELIGAKEKELEKLRQMKQALLDKMFPSNEEIAPPIRFKGFTEPWERKRLGNLCKINPNEEPLMGQFYYIDLESVEKGVLKKQRLLTASDAPSRAQRVLKKDDVLFQTVRPYQRNNYYFDKDSSRQWVASTGYAVLRSKTYPYFLFTILETETFNKEVINRCTGTTYPAITPSDIGKIEVAFCTFPEQQMIGDFFRSQDEAINSSKEEIAKLRTLKQACLQQMFA